MAENGPVDLGVLELINANLTSEGTVGLVEDVLGGNAELLVGEIAGVREVEGGRGDDDLGGVVELSGIEVVDDGLDALSRAVPMWLSASCPAGGMEGHRGASRGNWVTSAYILKFPPTKNLRGMMAVLVM